MTGIQNFRSKLKQIEPRKEIAQLVRLNAGNLIDGLRLMHKDMKLSKIEFPEKYDHILREVENLRRKLPIETELLLPYKRKRFRDEKLQWITAILANKARIRHLEKRMQSMQAALDEAKLENFALNDRSRREIQEIIDDSEMELSDVKHAADSEFAHLQEESSRKVLDLDMNNEYRDLVNEHNSKRRKITKLTVQLQLWIKKYDKFVGEPMKEMKTLEDDVDRFMEWKETVYEPQVEKYRQLKVSVELFESALMEEQAKQFSKEHAARVIQRAWRAARELRKSKKKPKKKGKKGLKGKSKKNK
ncbi:AAEL015106-PA [Aedes aegypti]|nr:AAEL015106-PA [Aedes aegypti]